MVARSFLGENQTELDGEGAADLESQETLCFVTFMISDEHYGIDIHSVREVVPLPTVTPLPHLPDHILGIFNLRGAIVSIVDLRKIFGLAIEGDSSKNRIVVLGLGDLVAGILVDEIGQAIEIPKARLEEPVLTLFGEKGEWIGAQVEWKDQLIGILDSDKLIERTCVNANHHAT